MPPVNWKKLEITNIELEKIIDLNLVSTLALNISRVLLGFKAYRKSLLFAEGCSLFLIYLFSFSTNLIIFRHLGWLSNNTRGLLIVLASSSFISVLALVIFNYCLWKKAKQFRILATLLEKVKQYNNLVEDIKLFEEVKLIDDSIDFSENITIASNLKNGLILTKASLIKSIEIEEIINRDRRSVNNRYHLLANLESGLANLSSLSETNSADYQKLLLEAVEIGLSAHQEIRKSHIR